jgi:uncharacterized protein YjdB
VPVATVSLSTATATLVPNQSGILEARTLDAQGNMLLGRVLDWSTSASGIATVTTPVRPYDGLITAVAVGTVTITATSEGKSAQSVVTVRDGGFISPAGGTVTAALGSVVVQVPAQALATATGITVTPAANPQADPKLIPGTAYDFGPNGTAFAQPVTITIKYDAAAVPAGANPAQFRVHKLVGTTWTPLAGSTVDVSTKSVIGQTSSFSTYAVLTVPVAIVSVTPDTATLLLGGTRQLSATLKAADGSVLTGPSVEWSSSNPGIATVSVTGLVSTVSLGTTVVTATSEGKAGTASIAVRLFAVTGVSPDTLSDGAVVTITGQGFAAAPSGVLVNIGGANATILSVTTTQVVVRVAQFVCHATQLTFVRVTSDGSTAPDFNRPLRSNGVTIALGVGQYGVNSASPRACLHFPASPAAGKYLVGVTDLSTSASTIPWTLDLQTRGGIAPGGTGATPAPINLALSASASPVPHPSVMQAPPRTVRDRQRENELAFRDFEAAQTIGIRSTGRGPNAASVMGVTAVAAVPAVGDLATYRFPTTGSACLFFSTITGRVRSVGQRYLLVEDVTNPILLDAADLARWGALLDQPIIPLDQQWFGTPTDFDGNGRIVILITKQVNLQKPGTIGFVRANDIKFSQSACASSNDGELFYMWALDPLGVAGTTPVSSNTFLANLLGTWAHEFVHIIQYSELFRLYGSSFLTPPHWIMEGGATLAEEIVGWAVQSQGPNQDLGASTALGVGVEGTEWFKIQWEDLQNYFGLSTSSTSRVQDAPESCIWTTNPPGAFSSCQSRGLYYGVSANFQRWLLDHANLPGGPTGFTKALYRSPIATIGNGMAALTSVTGLQLDAMLPAWQISLWADNRAAAGTAALQQPSWNLLDIFGAMNPFGRLVPRAVDWGAQTAIVAFVAAGSAQYTLLQGAVQSSTSFLVQAAGGTTSLPSDVRVWVLRVE